jgi:hypothetical protein
MHRRSRSVACELAGGAKERQTKMGTDQTQCRRYVYVEYGSNQHNRRGPCVREERLFCRSRMFMPIRRESERPNELKVHRERERNNGNERERAEKGDARVAKRSAPLVCGRVRSHGQQFYGLSCERARVYALVDFSSVAVAEDSGDDIISVRNGRRWSASVLDGRLTRCRIAFDDKGVEEGTAFCSIPYRTMPCTSIRMVLALPPSNFWSGTAHTAEGQRVVSGA